jgi:hypothetical protein
MDLKILFMQLLLSLAQANAADVAEPKRESVQCHVETDESIKRRGVKAELSETRSYVCAYTLTGGRYVMANILVYDERPAPAKRSK